mmetsp:Transcript_45472/g.90026  ORF Transcript_45472/g.90026 Transcript_45472/m.90026 type:complete len:313 (+) Transcript_45472:47-985(+)
MGSSASAESESAAAASAVAKVVAMRAANHGHGEGEATSKIPAATESMAAAALDAVEAPAAVPTAKAVAESVPVVESVEAPTAKTAATMEAPAITESTALTESASSGAGTPADPVQYRCQEQCAKPEVTTTVAAQDSKTTAAAAKAVSDGGLESQDAASTTDVKCQTTGAQSMRADAAEFVPTFAAVSDGQPGEQNPDYAMWAEWAANMAAVHVAAAGPWAALQATGSAEAMSLWPAAAGGLEGGRGLERDSPRTKLLTLCGAWGALAATGTDNDESVGPSLTRTELLQVRLPATNGLPRPKELATLRCAARE